MVQVSLLVDFIFVIIIFIFVILSRLRR